MKIKRREAVKSRHKVQRQKAQSRDSGLGVRDLGNADFRSALSLSASS